MNKTILQQIANTLYVNVQHVKQYGLLQGKLGIAIFFYHYAQHTGDKSFNDFSDEYIQTIFSTLDKSLPKEFTNGFSGIGWGINYIIKQGFVEADDDTLENIDLIMSKMNHSDYIKELESFMPLFSKGLYFIERDNKEIIEETLYQIDIFLVKLSHDQIPTMYINSIIYFTLMAMKKELNSDLCEKILEKSFILIKKHNYSIIDKILLKKNRSLMNNEIIKWNQLLDNNNDINNIHDINIINFIFSQGEQVNINMDILYNMAFKTIRQLNYNYLSIYHGLAGVGISIIKNSIMSNQLD